MTSPDDMSTRSGDSGLHTLTPDPSRCQSGQGGDGMSTPVKSIGDERSPTSVCNRDIVSFCWDYSASISLKLIPHVPILGLKSM